MHMRIPRLPLLLAALAIVGVWLLRPLTPHANADGGTITTTNTTLTYTHGPFFVPNPTDQVGPPQCGTATPCDDYALNVNVPSGTNATDQIQIQFAWDQSIDSETDFDLWVYDANGNVIASNVN